MLVHEHYKNGLTQNMVASGASAALGFALAMVSYPVYLHFLGYANYGLWVMISTFITLCQMGTLGMAPALSKLVAEEIGQDNRDGAQVYVELAISGVTALGTSTVALLFLFRTPILHRMALSPAT